MREWQKCPSCAPNPYPIPSIASRGIIEARKVYVRRCAVDLLIRGWRGASKERKRGCTMLPERLEVSHIDSQPTWPSAALLPCASRLRMSNNLVGVDPIVTFVALLGAYSISGLLVFLETVDATRKVASLKLH